MPSPVTAADRGNRDDAHIPGMTTMLASRMTFLNWGRSAVRTEEGGPTRWVRDRRRSHTRGRHGRIPAHRVPRSRHPSEWEASPLPPLVQRSTDRRGCRADARARPLAQTCLRSHGSHGSPSSRRRTLYFRMDTYGSRCLSLWPHRRHQVPKTCMPRGLFDGHQCWVSVLVCHDAV